MLVRAAAAEHVYVGKKSGATTTLPGLTASLAYLIHRSDGYEVWIAYKWEA